MSGTLRKGQWLEVRCPFCSDHHTHGAVNIRNGAYNCWKCGRHGMSEFVSVTANVPNEYREIVRHLEPYFTEAYISVNQFSREEERSTKVEKTIKMPGSSPLSTQMRRYLIGRGFNPTYMSEKYGLKDGGISGRWAHRLMIPINVDGKLVAWQGRSVGKNNPLRYMASSLAESVEDIKDVVYNLDNCPTRRCIAVEGIFDCWKIGDGCVALFGISLKDSQIRLLAERFDEVYILFDPEVKAQEQAKELARKLRNLGVDAQVLNMEDTDSEDPGDLKPSEVKQIRDYVFGEDIRELPWLRAMKE